MICRELKLANIQDLVTYEASCVDELEKEFIRAVDDYLLTCKKLDKTPNTPCKGSFNVRTGSDLHIQAVIAAQGKSLNKFVCEAIAEKISRTGITNLA